MKHSNDTEIAFHPDTTIIFEGNKNSEFKETDFELSKDNRLNYKDSFEVNKIFALA